MTTIKKWVVNVLLIFCLLSLPVAVDDAAPVRADVDASEDARIAGECSLTCASPLMLIVVDSHPRLPGVDRSEDATHARHLRCCVERHVRLACRRFAKADVVCFLDVRELREACARVE